MLLSDPVKTMSPKVEFFQSKGASSSDVAAILKVSPWIFHRSLKNCIIPYYDFLKGYHHYIYKTLSQHDS
ncbi:hypothetical protein L6164_012570 [Bauhinia variegata]|uniref:Uncharacterized protein n=1 Tax=Bauhinia variegata TaxID=167791 RepID=A0ACB9P9H3_BAUVA|nr:hypothetical protein L6164_012570 [Bauhinia variegata]